MHFRKGVKIENSAMLYEVDRWNDRIEVGKTVSFGKQIYGVITRAEAFAGETAIVVAPFDPRVELPEQSTVVICNPTK